MISPTFPLARSLACSLPPSFSAILYPVDLFATPSPATPALLWLRPEQVAFARAIAAAANLRYVGVGTPAKGRADALASEFSATAHTDLRAAMASCDVPLFLILDAGDFGAIASDEDPRAILAAASRNVTIATMSPLPASVQLLARGSWGAWQGQRHMVDAGAVDRIHLLATPTALATVRDAISAIEHDEPPRHMGLRISARADEHNLGGLLLGALDCITRVLPSPESIDCVYTSSQMTAALHALPGESLHDIQGDAACLLRFTTGASASVDVSSAAGGFSLELTMLGAFGRITVRHDGFAPSFLWLSATGEEVETPKPTAPAHAGTLAALVAAELTTLLHDEARGLPQADIATVLPIAQAALLSARTSQPESPDIFLRILG